VIIKALISRRVRLSSLCAVPEEAQRRERSLSRFTPRDKVALDAHRVSGQREPDDGDAGRRARARVIRD